MPKVTFVKAARKDNPVCSAGESYYWWKFRFGGKLYSLKPPRPSQLTQSSYYGGIRSMVEQIEDHKGFDVSDLGILRDDLVEQLTALGDEAEESRENMPEGLQEGDTGQMLQERYEMCQNASGELEGLDLEFTSELDIADDPTERELQEEREDWVNEQLSQLGEFVSECEF